MNPNTMRRSAPVPITLSEATEPSLKSLQILKTGTFYDPRYNNFQVTEKHFAEMISNFEKGVRGVIPTIDYAHETDGPSGGWLKKLYTKPLADGKIGLFGDFKLTPRGNKTLADEDYAYTSADYDESYVCNETGENHGCVLKGLAFTNRPVIKRMAPAIQLSEGSEATAAKIAALVKNGKTHDEAVAIVTQSDRDVQLSEEDEMTEEQKKQMAELQKQADAGKKLSEALGAADPEAAMAKVAEMKAAAAPAPKDEEVEPSEAEKKLSEANAKIAKMENEAKFSKLLSEGKVVEAQREPFLAGKMEEFARLQQPIKLSEQGHGAAGKTDDGEKDVEDEVMEKAKKLSDEKKIPIHKAMAEVLASDKKLSERRLAKFDN